MWVVHIENLCAFTSQLYYTSIRVIDIYATINLKFIHPNIILFDMRVILGQ